MGTILLIKNNLQHKKFKVLSYNDIYRPYSYMKTVKFELSSPNKYGNHNTYRITSVLKAKTDIIASIAASPTGRAVIMYVKIFKNDVNVFIGDVKMCLTSH